MPFNCQFCKKVFQNKSNLSRHQKTTKSCLKIQEKKKYKDISVITYDCDICQKKFTSKQILNSHKKSCPGLPIKKHYEILLNDKEKLLLCKESQIKRLENENSNLLRMNEYLSQQSSQQYVKELQDKLHEIAMAAIETKNERICGMVKKYVKKQPRQQYGNNVVYILTTNLLKSERRYILGKAKNLTNRLSTYNKSDEHEVVYYQECKNEDMMNVAETVVFQKLGEYREQANRERFILPDNKDISFFIEMVKECLDFLK
jgi:hypothetical protein